MTSLIPFGTAFINPDHVVSVIPDRVTPDGVCLITVFMTSGPVITYEVPGGDMPGALVRVQKLITEAGQ